MNKQTKYLSSKTFLFLYYKKINPDTLYNFIKKEFHDRNKEILYLIIKNTKSKTYCFIEIDERIQIKNRFFLTFKLENENIIPKFLKSKKKNMIKKILMNDNNFCYYSDMIN